MIEYVDHLHEHFVSPVVLEKGRYLAPLDPGFSAQMRAEALRHYVFPEGLAWVAGEQSTPAPTMPADSQRHSPY